MRLFSKRLGIAVLVGWAVLLCIAPISRATSIFDDDYAPPKRAEPETPTPAPMPAKENPAVPVPTNPPQPANKSPDPAPVAARHGLPDKQGRAKCRKLFEEVYAAELKDRLPAARRKLAEKLLDESAKNPEGSPDRYMLLVGAVQAAEEGQSLRIAFAAAKQLSDGYGVDELATKTDAATKTFAGPASATLSSLSNIEALFSLSDQLVAEEAFATNALVETALQKAVPTIADPDLKIEAKNQIRDVAAMRDARQKIAPALAKLRQTPDDPAANLAVGSYYCFQQGNWEKGLPMLAKSSDAKLKELATTELAGPADGDAKVTLADNWVTTATKLPAPDRPKALQHAAGLYRDAKGSLTDLSKLAVEKRLSQIPPPTRLRRVDLLGLFDPATSIVSGVWKSQDGSLACESTKNAIVYFAYEPPEEYDFQISFTVVHASNGVGQVCYSGGHQFIYITGGWNKGIAAFDMVKGAGGDNNPAAKRKDHWFADSQHYTQLIKVRKTGVEAYLDGKLTASLKTDYSDVSLWREYRLPYDDAIAITAHVSAIRFESAEVIEITGEGKILSGK